MADSNAALAAALTALTTVLTNMQANPPMAPVAPVAAPVIDAFQATAPFDLSSHAGSHAYTAASAPLDDEWDGTIAKFPLFLIALCICATEVNWGAAAPHGILIYAVAGEDKNLFMDHHSISQAIIETACVGCTDNRAIQNSRALYKCLKSSIEGDLRASLFDQDGNIPTHEDAPTLFKILTSFTMSSSLQLSMMSFQHILELETGNNINPPAHILGDSDAVSRRLTTSTTLTTPTNLGSNNTNLSGTTDISNVTSLLAAALSLASNNSAAKEAIVDTLNAIHDK